MTSRDEELTCASCGTRFLFTTVEARFYAERGLAPPKRCKDCRRARKESAAQSRSETRARGRAFGPARSGDAPAAPPSGSRGRSARDRAPSGSDARASDRRRAPEGSAHAPASRESHASERRAEPARERAPAQRDSGSGAGRKHARGRGGAKGARAKAGSPNEYRSPMATGTRAGGQAFGPTRPDASHADERPRAERGARGSWRNGAYVSADGIYRSPGFQNERDAWTNAAQRQREYHDRQQAALARGKPGPFAGADARCDACGAFVDTDVDFDAADDRLLCAECARVE